MEVNVKGLEELLLSNNEDDIMLAVGILRDNPEIDIDGSILMRCLVEHVYRHNLLDKPAIRYTTPLLQNTTRLRWRYDIWTEDIVQAVSKLKLHRDKHGTKLG